MKSSLSLKDYLMSPGLIRSAIVPVECVNVAVRAVSGAGWASTTANLYLFVGLHGK